MQWKLIKKEDKRIIEKISREHGLSYLQAKLLYNRDIISKEAVGKYLYGNFNDLYNPETLKDSDKAVEILKDAFLNQTFDNLDILSTHTFVDNWDISSIQNIDITNNVFSGSFVGTVSVILQYGSDRERQIGDGMVSYDTYDFSSDFSFEIPDIQEIMHQMNLNDNNYKNHISELKETFIREIINIIEIEEPNINTSSFYK